jgi:hypothetical protein
MVTIIFHGPSKIAGHFLQPVKTTVENNRLLSEGLALKNR